MTTHALSADRALCRALLPRVSRTFAVNIRLLHGRFRMRLEPVPRRALRLPDLGIRHLGCDLAAKLSGLAMAFHGRDVEPLVCRDEIDRNLATARVHHAKLEHRVGRDRARSDFRRRKLRHFQKRHNCSPPVRARSLSGVALASPVGIPIR